MPAPSFKLVFRNIDVVIQVIRHNSIAKSLCPVIALVDMDIGEFLLNGGMEGAVVVLTAKQVAFDQGCEDVCQDGVCIFELFPLLQYLLDFTRQN